MTNRATTPTDSAILKPQCPKCGSPMHLERIEPDRPEHDRRTYRCDACGESASETMKYR